MSELQRHWRVYLVAIGAIAAWVGLTIWGMARSYDEHRELDLNAGMALMIGGVIVLVIGVLAYMRRPEDHR